MRPRFLLCVVFNTLVCLILGTASRIHWEHRTDDLDEFMGVIQMICILILAGQLVWGAPGRSSSGSSDDCHHHHHHTDHDE